MTIDKAQLKALAIATFEHLPGVSDPKMIVQASDVLFLLAEIDHLERESKSGLIAYNAAIDGQKELREERDQLKAENESLRKDAERYRWIEKQPTSWFSLGEAFELPSEHDGATGLDGAIDAAMGKEAGGD